MVIGPRNFLLLIALLAAQPLWAATHYVTANGAGSHTGADWNNAYASLPTTLTRGDTYVLCGGTYGHYTFNTAESGTTIITIRKAQAGTFNGVVYNDDQVAGWNSNCQTNQVVFTSSSQVQFDIATGYITLDGVQPAGYWSTSGYGIKLMPGNNNQSNYPIDAGAVSGIVIKHVEIPNAGQSYDQEQFDIYLDGTTNAYVGYSYLHKGQQAVRIGGATGTIIEYNYIGEISYFSDHHGEQIGMLLKAYSSGPAPSDTTIRYNLFDDSGTANTTGQIIDLTNTGDIDNGVYVYGNVFRNLTGHNGIGSGNSGSPGSLTNWKLYNNTFINSDVSFCGLSTGGEVRNNIFYNSWAHIFGGGQCTFAPPTRTNNYWNSSTNDLGSGTNDITSSESTSVLFQDYAGANYHIGANSQARQAGYALSAPFNLDPDGTTRTPGAWDIGSYQFNSSAGSPEPPTQLVLSVN